MKKDRTTIKALKSKFKNSQINNSLEDQSIKKTYVRKKTGFFKLNKGNYEKVDDDFTYKKEDIEKLHCNLPNIANVVREAF